MRDFQDRWKFIEAGGQHSFLVSHKLMGRFGRGEITSLGTSSITMKERFQNLLTSVDDSVAQHIHEVPSSRNVRTAMDPSALSTGNMEI